MSRSSPERRYPQSQVRNWLCGYALAPYEKGNRVHVQATSQDGTAIAYGRISQRPAVALVGGAFQYRAIDKRTAQVAALLAEQFTIVHYDWRGRGDSLDTASYAVEREIEDLEALIQEMGGSACVFGMFSGGPWRLMRRRKVLRSPN